MTGIDEPLWWFVCGDEGGSVIFGPFVTREPCETGAQYAGCEHHHAIFLRSPRLVARMAVKKHHPLRHSGCGPSLLRLVERGGNEWTEIVISPANGDWYRALYREMLNSVLEPEEEELPTLPPRVPA